MIKEDNLHQLMFLEEMLETKDTVPLLQTVNQTIRFSIDQQPIQVRDLAWAHLLIKLFKLMFPLTIQNQ